MKARTLCLSGLAGNLGQDKATLGGAPTPTEGLTTRSVYLLMADLNLMDRGVVANARDESYIDAAGARWSDG